MKKSAITAMLALTLSFATFVIGFYVGRNYDHTNIQISGLPLSTKPASNQAAQLPTVTTVPATLDQTTQRIMAAINASTLEELDAITNIGQVTAKKILDYRNQYGFFEKPEDLLNISGIGEKTLQNIMDYFLGRLEDEDTGS